MDRRITIPRLANPAPGRALAAAAKTPAQPVTASAVTEGAGLREASTASGAARPRVIGPARRLLSEAETKCESAHSIEAGCRGNRGIVKEEPIPGDS